MSETPAQHLLVAASAMRLVMPSGVDGSGTEVAPIDGVAGQDRAREAIEFGLAIAGEGYNIVVSGTPSSGRNATALLHVEAAARSRPPAPDWCYVHNFSDPRRPRAIRLPAGTARELERLLAQLAEVCKTELPRAFDSDAYAAKVQQTIQPLTQEREGILEQLQDHARQQGFVLNPTPMGLVPVPRDPAGNPMTPDEYNALPPAARETLDTTVSGVQEAIATAMRQVRHIEAQARQAVEAVDREITRFVVGHVFEDLQQRFGGDGLHDHFAAIESDVAANLAVFKRFTDGFAENAPEGVVTQFTAQREMVLRQYQVNRFVSNDPDGHAPVKEERHPSLSSLFGHVEFENRMGTMITDFMHVRAGAFQVANGGFLILQLPDVLADPRAWVTLKRALKTREVRAADPAEGILPFPTVDLQPQGIPLDLKVILVGDPRTVAILDALDPDFAALFKIRAEFEPDVEVTKASVEALARFVARLRKETGLQPFTAGGIEEVVQFASRLAGQQDRLSTRLGLIGDLCAEAHQVALKDGAPEVTAAHVLAALAAQRGRSGLLADRLRRMIASGVLRVDTVGSVVGQINGLAVYDVGHYAFGTPARITCRIGLGRQGVVAIERETERSGAIHTKGVLVLSGFLAGTFGRRRPLTFNASLTFEQSYDEVEGDSASSAELYAILTALADIPVRQSIAVTGSVDQFGNVQAVGGVTEKVEGFFDLCDALGLDGQQGVMIPATNVRSLTLRPDVIAAAREGRFHIWAIARIEEGIELLTGIPAGTLNESGAYPEGTIFRRVADVLAAMHEVAPAAAR